MMIIISCGAKKAMTPSRAKLMYIGSHFRNCLRWARRKTDDSKIFILSARYGLLRLEDQIAPYDLKMGQPGSVTVEKVRAQAAAFGISGIIFSTAGAKYREILKEIFPNIHFPFEGRSMGLMAQAMKRDG